MSGDGARVAHGGPGPVLPGHNGLVRSGGRAYGDGMPSAIANGVDLYYEAHGHGPVILGIHGSPSSAVLWEPAAVRLGALGTCVVYDRRGYGRSTAPEPFEATDLDDQVADAAALLDRLGAESAIVIGRSTGGLIALELAHSRPHRVDGLVLLEPALFTVDGDTRAWAAQLRAEVLAAAGDDPARAAEAVVRIALGDEAWDAMDAGVRDLLRAGGRAVLAEIRGRGLDLSAEPLELSDAELSGIEVPTLLVSAAGSPAPLRRVVPRLAARLPRASAAVVAGGHLIDPASPVVLEFVRPLTEP
ncbi:Pimeloyl-ACP methyl ester carboxylesterase [Jiangella alkaliphila]|uniref:Pimeloyl-ACP methyl ester carboxylesterase n=2 Tax=Jiangella alkaliphila TaxID=419479 RepID=A0A1H2JSS8_9ACTN|nr:Pimeloyl-ACP methyl ester carboxylesterase [Jiangella alkaliphila]